MVQYLVFVDISMLLKESLCLCSDFHQDLSQLRVSTSNEMWESFIQREHFRHVTLIDYPKERRKKKDVSLNEFFNANIDFSKFIWQMLSPHDDDVLQRKQTD